MSEISRAAIKTYFETNDFPSQSEFTDFIDSCVNYVSDNINSALLGNCYFISKNGNDTTGKKGTDIRPFLTIAAVLAVYTTGDTIILMPGVWDESFSLSTNVNFFFMNGAKIIYSGTAAHCIDFTAGTKYIFSGDVYIERTAGTTTDTVIKFSSSSNSQVKFSNTTIISNNTYCIDFNTTNSSIRFEQSLIISSSSVAVVTLSSALNIAFIDCALRSKSSSSSASVFKITVSFTNTLIFKNTSLTNDYATGYSFSYQTFAVVAFFSDIIVTNTVFGMGTFTNTIIGTSLLINPTAKFPFE